MTSTGNKCRDKNRRGDPCGAWAGDDGLCFWHSPSRAKERAAARRAGGLARHGRAIGTTGDPGQVDITSVDDVIRLLASEIQAILGLERSISRARCVGYLASVALKSFDLGEYDQRLAAVEKALAEQQKSTAGRF